MKKAPSSLQKAIATASSFTGRRFAALVASSLLATAAIVVSAAGGSGGIGPLAEAAARAYLNEEPAAVAAAPTAAPTPEATPAAPSSAPEAVPTAEPGSSGLLPAPAPAAPEAPPPSEPETPAAPPPSEPELPEAGPVKHVFLISLASPGYDAAFNPAAAQMPYLSGELREKGVLLSNYALLDLASLPNGLAAIGGQKPTAASKADCPEYEKCLLPVETLSLADQLTTGRYSWHAYLEDMADAEAKPGNCVHPEPDAPEAPPIGGYAAKLNPFVYFHSLLDLGDCAANDAPLSELAGDLKKPDTTADFNYIAPNLCDAGFRGQCPEGTADGAAAADAFLAELVPQILASPAYKQDGLLIVSFGAADPAPPTDPAAAPVDPLKTGALLVSPLLTPGGTDATHYDPYSLLRSIEDLFGLAPLGAAEDKQVRSFASAFVATETAAGD